MEIVILREHREAAELAAAAIVDVVRSKEHPVLGLATGSSPVPVYRALTRHHREEGVSFAGCSAFTLDEYVALPADHPASYRSVIRSDFTAHIDIDDSRVHAPDGTAEDLPAAAAAYEAAIETAGGVDIQLLGIGSDGHVGFNEPTSSLCSRTRIKTLTEQTRRDNARFFDDDLTAVPTHCLTQGLGTILQARHLILLAQGGGKAEAVRQLVEGPVSARWPATALQWHPHVSVLVDEDAAQGLELADYYRHAWENKPTWQGL